LISRRSSFAEDPFPAATGKARHGYELFERPIRNDELLAGLKCVQRRTSWSPATYDVSHC